MLRLLLLLGFLSTTMALTAHADDVQSVWNQEAVTIDGWANEWQGQGYSYFNDENTALAIRNDADNLYIIILSQDKRYVPSLARGGITFWLNPKANKDKQLGFEYKTPLRMRPPENNSQGSDRPARQWRGRRDTVTSFTMISGDQKQAIGQDSPTGTKAAATIDNGKYCCEIQIPVSELKDHGIDLQSLKEGELGLGIESGKFERPERRDGGFGEGGFHGGFNGGGMQGGGMRGEGRGKFEGGRRGDFVQPEQLKMWVKVALAKSENQK